ncbi:hypothetical protein LQ954_12715 [Sphingomonas sp. IC-11]|uniref:hypothetical protein n=1 Tax=Sphingomonas sp. IC-11 TaxID=2898528 RepID=UPI001E51F302|nr:hypothetical protein [Sphingomonas sp. IC-11]MCD2317010.1 hypothetical protein [Sphingomonas sp. IC-11]
MQDAPIIVAESPRPSVSEQRVRFITVMIACGALLLVIARVLTFPLKRDEQFYIMGGVLFSPGMYENFGFSHLPNLPLLFSIVFDALGTTHYVLVARLIIAVGWIAATLAAWRIGRDIAGSTSAAAIIMAALLFNPVFLDQTGMAATNNFLPVPLILWGLWAFVRSVDEGGQPKLAFLTGLLLATAAGMKANYAVVIAPMGAAALLMPAQLPWRQRLVRFALPMAVGAIIGLLPTLYFLAQDPASFFVHTVSFHRGPQLGFWSQISREAAPAITPRAKFIVASGVWLGGASLVLIAVLIYSAVQARLLRSRDGILATLLAMLFLAAAISFVPTPAFSQYYTLPIPFLLMVFAVTVRRMSVAERALAAPVFWSAAGAITLAGIPVTLPSLLDGVRPQRWTGIAVHREAEKIAALVQGPGPIATAGPLHVAEGGGSVYPQLALGPFVLRAMEFVPANERAYFRHPESRAAMDEVFRQARPAAVLTGFDATLDPGLAAFAIKAGYRAVALPPRRSGREDRDGSVLYVRPGGAAR